MNLEGVLDVQRLPRSRMAILGVFFSFLKTSASKKTLTWKDAQQVTEVAQRIQTSSTKSNRLGRAQSMRAMNIS